MRPSNAGSRKSRESLGRTLTETTSEVFVPITAGKGVPLSILNRVESAKIQKSARSSTQEIKSQLDKLLDEPFRLFSNADQSQAPTFADIVSSLNLDEYDFQADDEEPKELDVQLDVTALDRYNEDVRKHRRALLEECRLLPLTSEVKIDLNFRPVRINYIACGLGSHNSWGEIDRHLLDRIRHAAFNLCRSCYYGTQKAQNLAEPTMQLMVWLLNRRNVPILFHIRILESLSEMVWNSRTLKLSLTNTNGVQVLLRLMKSGMLHHSSLACWAVYAFIAGGIGCGEVIADAKSFSHIDEFCAEMAFSYYWRDWPANFGHIFQGIIFGPHSVVPLEEDHFTFL